MSDRNPEESPLFSRISQDHFIILFLSLVVLASGADLLADLNEGVKTAHLLQEGAILLVALAAISWIAWSLRRRSREVVILREQLEEVRNLPQPAEVVEARRRLGEVISSQFSDWKLTASEREVGLLLLKGFSLKEIAALRGTSEKTIRQQASSVYKKAGLSGRHARGHTLEAISTSTVSIRALRRHRPPGYWCDTHGILNCRIKMRCHPTALR
jgi:DNA-binding CsgD family transcriptional regulator